MTLDCIDHLKLVGITYFSLACDSQKFVVISKNICFVSFLQVVIMSLMGFSLVMLWAKKKETVIG